jgi:hypothetical protein
LITERLPVIEIRAELIVVKPTTRRNSRPTHFEGYLKTPSLDAFADQSFKPWL